MSIIETDCLDGLIVYNYDDSTYDKELLNVRGLVKDGEQVVCKTFGYTPEVLANDFDNLNAYISPLVTDQTRFFKAYEATVLRVWFYNNKWYLSTHRKIDASHSKWGHSCNYQTLFERALKYQLPARSTFETFCADLDTNKIYAVLLRSFKENRKVCRGQVEPSLYCAGSFNRANNFEFSFENPEIGIPSPEELLNIQSPADLINRVNQIDPYEYQGIVLINPDAMSGKIVNVEYDRLDKLRGNVPNVIHRYVQLRWTPHLEEYKSLYPEHQSKFNHWEMIMSYVVQNVMQKYLDKYVHRLENVHLPSDQYGLLLEVHKYYMSILRPHKRRVEIDDIWDLLGTWTEREVNVLYNKYNERKNASVGGRTSNKRKIHDVANTTTVENH